MTFCKMGKSVILDFLSLEIITPCVQNFAKIGQSAALRSMTRDVLCVMREASVVSSWMSRVENLRREVARIIEDTTRCWLLLLQQSQHKRRHTRTARSFTRPPRGLSLCLTDTDRLCNSTCITLKVYRRSNSSSGSPEISAVALARRVMRYLRIAIIFQYGVTPSAILNLKKFAFLVKLFSIGSFFTEI